MVEPGVRDGRVAEARSEFAAVGFRAFDAFDQPPVRGITLQPPAPEPTVAPRPPRRRTQRFTISKILGRVWIPLLIALVIGAGGVTVSRLHGIFGAEQRPVYADSQIIDPAPFDPKHLTYEIFGPPGTVARISYFDANADPKRVEAAHLPWSLTFAMTDATAVGSVVAQGDSDAIGCRIVVDGVVKSEKITHETSAFTFCALKSS